MEKMMTMRIEVIKLHRINLHSTIGITSSIFMFLFNTQHKSNF